MKISKTDWCWAIPLVFSGVLAPETFQKTISTIIAPLVPADTLAPVCMNAVPDSGCATSVLIAFHLDGDCPGGALQQVIFDANNDGQPDGTIDPADISGQYPDYSVESGFPLGSHRLEVLYSDTCGNNSQQDFVFEVVDCTPPQFSCLNGYAITYDEIIDVDGDSIPDWGLIEVPAAIYIIGAGSDCSLPIRYSIHLTMEIQNGTDIPNPDQSTLIYDVCQGQVVFVTIYAWDDAFNPYSVQPDGVIGGPNYSFCENYLIVNNFLGLICGDPALTADVNGNIRTENQEGINGVRVSSINGYGSSTITNSNGAYQLTLSQGEDCEISPSLDENAKNGVSTFDVVLITKHILGIQPLDSPYKMIAADANNSKQITTNDIIHLRKLILGLTDEFSNNTSWRFVPAAYVFPDPSNPWLEEFPETVILENLPLGYTTVNFIGIKIGDVNNSVTP